MPKRNVVFQDEEYYHVFNRAIANQTIFKGKRSLGRALSLLDFYRYPKPDAIPIFAISQKKISKNI